MVLRDSAYRSISHSGIMHPKMADYALILHGLFLRSFWYMTSAADTRGAGLPTETPIYA